MSPDDSRSDRLQLKIRRMGIRMRMLAGSETTTVARSYPEVILLLHGEAVCLFLPTYPSSSSSGPSRSSPRTGCPSITELLLRDHKRRGAETMRLPPASVLASWPAPNYVDPVRRGPAGQIVSIVLAVAAAVVLAMRMYTRLRVVRSFGLDDVLILVAFVRMNHTPERPFSELLTLNLTLDTLDRSHRVQHLRRVSTGMGCAHMGPLIRQVQYEFADEVGTCFVSPESVNHESTVWLTCLGTGLASPPLSCLISDRTSSSSRSWPCCTGSSTPPSRDSPSSSCQCPLL